MADQDFPAGAGAFMAGLLFGPLGLIYGAVLSSQLPAESRRGYMSNAWTGAIVQVVILAFWLFGLAPELSIG